MSGPGAWLHFRDRQGLWPAAEQPVAADAGVRRRQAHYNMLRLFAHGPEGYSAKFNDVVRSEELLGTLAAN